ncbi:MAG: class I SAM-dependent methyltransferase [Ilumatobacteraceae bacterium]
MTAKWTEDARLVATYDVECADRRDHDFYLERVQALVARTVIDLGCGTGVFATAVADLAVACVGVDPAAAMLAAAQARDPGRRVTWLLGDPDALTSDAADLIVMMGHVAQYFVDDDDWQRALAGCHRALRPDGRLTFETRNPTRRAWEHWTKAETYERLPHPDGGWFESWVDVVDVTGTPDAPTETHAGHTILPDGQHVIAHETLRFRTEAEITAALDTAGFVVESVLGDWDGSPYHAASPEMIFLARR